MYSSLLVKLELVNISCNAYANENIDERGCVWRHRDQLLALFLLVS